MLRSCSQYLLLSHHDGLSQTLWLPPGSTKHGILMQVEHDRHV